MLFDINNPITDWFFPRRCLVCAEDISVGEMCDSCYSFCHRCPALFDSEKHNALFYFELTIKEIIKNAKFYKNSAHLHLLYRLICNEINKNYIHKIREFSPDFITYVPNHWLHKMVRGAELPSFFANILSSKLNIPVVEMLRKTSFLKRQALQKSKKERQLQIQGAFGLKKNIMNSRILLVDDIVTTGATLNELKKLFGKNQVCCVAIAKTP